MNLQDYEKVCLAIKALYYVVDYKQPLFDPSNVAQKKAREKKTSRSLARRQSLSRPRVAIFPSRVLSRHT